MEAIPHFFDLDPARLEGHILSWGWQAYRAKQLMGWVYEKGVADPYRMTDLSRHDRETVARRLAITTLEIDARQEASDGTRKLLMSLPERGGAVECVMIPSLANAPGRQRRTACISSQVGCPVGCAFCASGLGGLERNLTAGQIVEQVWRLNDELGTVGSEPLRITNVVFMGMGEPLSNFENVTRAIRTLNARWGMNISGRKITVSTVGLPAQIRRLAGLEIPVTLAISLHAPDDELRRQLIPWANYTSIEDILEAARFYFDQTGREVTLEYILLGGVNDQPRHARRLAEIARSLRCNVNLIRYNEVRGLPFDRPATQSVLEFRSLLAGKGVNAHIRASRGRDIAAACGQLRHETARAG